MNFRDCFLHQLSIHRSMRPSDVAKLCYQAAYGAEHLLTDVERAKRYFDSEFDSVEERGGDILELISPSVARIDLGAWKSAKIPKDWLFNIFLSSATVANGGRETLLRYLSEAETCLDSSHVGFSRDEWSEFIQAYKNQGMPAIHHSEEYRQAEKPAYRIVDSKALLLLPILKRAAELESNPKTKIIAIDGRAASGKSTLSRLLSAALDAPVVHMDDFFLPPELRSEARLAEAGGNIHYERFADEVLPYIRSSESFAYKVFDCSQMAFGEERLVKKSEWRIVEGSYSHHPNFGDYADIRVLVTVDENTQAERILERNGERMAEIFKKRWIPMEEAYFDKCEIAKNSDFAINTRQK